MCSEPEASWKPWSFKQYDAMQINLRTNLYDKNDLTPRQIEWCRANIPMFAEMERLRGVK